MTSDDLKALRTRRLVVLESPYAGDIEANIAYAKRCVHDCLLRNEAPIASHLLFTQPGILDDTKPEERLLGMASGWAWIPNAAALVVYTDNGVSSGMTRGIHIAEYYGIPIIYRSLEKAAQHVHLTIEDKIRISGKQT